MLSTEEKKNAKQNHIRRKSQLQLFGWLVMTDTSRNSFPWNNYTIIEGGFSHMITFRVNIDVLMLSSSR